MNVVSGPRTIRSFLLTLLALASIGHPALSLQPEPDVPQTPEVADEPDPWEQTAETFVFVEGQITDDIGAGQRGVKVEVRRKVAGDTEGTLVATATTDELGDFAVRVTEPTHGDFVVTFSLPDYADLVREIHVGDEEFPPFLAEILEGKLIVIGRVIDALTTKPVSGASVTLVAKYKEWREESDEEGRFTIKSVIPGRGELVVESEGYGRQRQAVQRLEDFGEIVVNLKPERIVHIHAVDDGGAPVAGVTIECFDEPRDDFRTLVTDLDGKATVRGLHFDAARLSVRLTHDEFVSDGDFDRNIVTPETETESIHRLVMTRGGRIVGRVTDAGTGDALYGARVMTGTADSHHSPRDWSNFEGHYEIGGVAPGPTNVTVHLAGYAPEISTIEVEAGEVTTLDIKLGPCAVLRGMVKNEDAEPVSGAFIEATEWRGHTSLGLRAVTGPDGRFVLENAPLDAFEITVSVPRGGSVTKTVKAGGDAGIEITLAGTPMNGRAGAGIGWLLIGDTAPVLKLKTLEGKVLKFADLKGKTILLDFWATWCAPCVADLPHLLAIHKKHAGREDFVMISVSLDGDEKALRDFVKKWKMTWHQVFGEAGGAQTAAKRYGVDGVPALFLIGPNGKLIAAGPSGEAMKKKVEQVLKDSDPT